jgi:hypothetical protein
VSETRVSSPNLALVVARQAQRLDLAVGDGEIVLLRVVAVIVERQRRVGAGLLVDSGHAEHGLQGGAFARRVVPAQAGAEAVVIGVVAPAVGVADIEVGAQAAEAAETGVGFGQHAVPAVAAGFAGDGRAGLGRRRTGDDVDDAADGVGAVERGAGPAHHLDAARRRYVEFVERVVIEEAGRAGGHAVLEEEIDRVGGEGLADGGGVSFAVGDRHGDAGDLAEDLLGVRGRGEAYRFLLHDTDRSRGLQQAFGFAGAGDGHDIELFARSGGADGADSPGGVQQRGRQARCTVLVHVSPL